MPFGNRHGTNGLKKHDVVPFWFLTTGRREFQSRDVGAASSSGHGGEAVGSPDGGSRTAASVVFQKPNIPSVSTQQLPILPKPTSNSTTPSSQTQPLLSSSSSSAITPSARTVKALRIRSTDELGLLSLLFVLSTAFAAVFSVAILRVPTINAMRRLAAAVDKLSNVVSHEVPGTLSSLKLSSFEINDLAKQLTALREQISATGFGKNSE